MYEANAPALADKKAASALPQPAGYRILIALPEMKEKTDGGVILDNTYLSREQQASIVGFVVKIGPDAYADKVRFPNGPWCAEGNWVIFRAYAGTRLKIKGSKGNHDFVLLNDDSIEAVVEDPQLYTRSF